MIEVARSANPRILDLLRGHPHVALVQPGDEDGISFVQHGRTRTVRVADAAAEIGGLIELMDNNPLVCADRVAVPSPAATLALIALGPMAVAGLIAEPPIVVVNSPVDEPEIVSFLADMGWKGEVFGRFEDQDLGGAVAAAVMIEFATLPDPEDIDALYEERYGRSFFVRREEESDWHVSEVLGSPFAQYRLRLSEGEPNSLLTIQVMADAHGKAGEAQLVHAMNVMAGFEESLGVTV